MSDTSSSPTADVTDDWFLDGRLLLRQPSSGYRAGTDALLVAAAAATDAARTCDLGAGVGTIGLSLALRGAPHMTLVEREPLFVACARQTIQRSGLEDRVSLVSCDLFDRKAVRAEPLLADCSFDQVVTNPPYDQSLKGRRTPSALKQAAHAMAGGTLADWLATAARLLKDGGHLVMIHRADQLAGILSAMPARLGGMCLKPILPQEGKAATRLLIRATAGSRAPLSLLPEFVLHGQDGTFTPEAERIHKGRAALNMRP